MTTGTVRLIVVILDLIALALIAFAGAYGLASIVGY